MNSTTSAYQTDDARWEAMRSRDVHADGHFVYAVRTTGVYCRPSSSTRLPKRANVEFFHTAEAAEAAGYRRSRRASGDPTSAATERAALVTRICRLIDESETPAQLDAEGYALLPRAFAPDEARELATQVDTLTSLHRVSLSSMDLGQGDILRFGATLPTPWATWRDILYRRLAPVANRWNEALDVEYRYPAELEAFLRLNRNSGQTQQLSHLNRLGPGDYLALHQNNEGEHVFPLQVVALLSEPGKDFLGGEFVLTEQRPRMQSRPMVLPLRLGDMAIISTAQKPFRGSKGFYRVNLKHAISRVREGKRIGVELSFHDAP